MKRIVLMMALAICSAAAFSQQPSRFYTGIVVGTKSTADKATITKITAVGNKATLYSGTTPLSIVNPDSLSYKEFGVYKKDSLYAKPGSYVSQYQFKTKATNSNVHKTIKKLGGDVDVIPIAMQITGASAALNLNDAQILWALCEIIDSVTVNSVVYNQAITGTSIYDAYNGYGLYSVSGTTCTKIAETVTSSTTFTQTANNNITATFPSSYTLVPGYYYIAILGNWSTANTLAALNSVNIGWLVPKVTLTNDLKIAGQTTTQASLPATIQTSSIVATNYCPGVILK